MNDSYLEMRRMLTNIFFYCYIVLLGCAIPMSIGVQHGLKNEKLEWADSVIFIATQQLELLCVEDVCAPISEAMGAGTSFVIDKKENETTLMTAAHLCEPRELPRQSPLNIEANFQTVFHMTIIDDNEMTLVSDILFLDSVTDICIFTVPKALGKKMKISKRNPRYGDNVWSIGAPTGYFPQSAKPITKGVFSGEALRFQPNGGKLEFFNFNMPTIGGMSGSPIINEKGKVIGLVSAVHNEWHLISYSPTLEQIRAAIETIEE